MTRLAPPSRPTARGDNDTILGGNGFGSAVTAIHMEMQTSSNMRARHIQSREFGGARAHYRKRTLGGRDDFAINAELVMTLHKLF